MDIILPMVCILCGGRATRDNICTPCLHGLPGNSLACSRCALPLPGKDKGECGACIRQPPHWNRALVPLLFEFPVDHLVRKLKFHRNLAAARPLARAMSMALNATGKTGNALIIPVPLHWSRGFLRGYNQSVELARIISRNCRLPANYTHFERIRYTPAQSGLDAGARRKNLKGAFRWKGQDLQGRHIVLVDDVLTTGSTMAECTRVLRHHGAGSIDILAAARAT